MAITTENTLTLTLLKATGDSFNYNVKRVDPSRCTGTAVNTFAGVLVDNGRIFQNIPAAIKAAKVKTVTTSDVALS